MPRPNEAQRYGRLTYDVQVYDNATWTRIGWFVDYLNQDEIRQRVTNIAYENGLEFDDVSYKEKEVR